MDDDELITLKTFKVFSWEWRQEDDGYLEDAGFSAEVRSADGVVVIQKFEWDGWNGDYPPLRDIVKKYHFETNALEVALAVAQLWIDKNPDKTNQGDTFALALLCGYAVL